MEYFHEISHSVLKWNCFPAIRVRNHQDSERNQDRLKNALDATGSERTQLEHMRQMLNEQVDQMNAENLKLQAANADLQRHRDHLEDQKDDVMKDKERQMKENERW